MAQTHVEGRVSSEIELKISAKSNPYVRFELVEQIGSKGNGRTQFFHVCAFANDAISFVQAGVKKGDLIQIFGTLEFETFGKSDGKGIGTRMKILLRKWGYVPIGASKEIKSLEQVPPETVEPIKVIEIDGEKEPLPR